jgi:hypothetical protein
METPAPFTEALDKYGKRLGIAATLDSSEWAQVPVQIRERAFFSAGVETARLLQEMRDTIGDYLAGARLPGGGLVAQGRQEFVKLMREIAIQEGLGRVDDQGNVLPVINENDVRDIRSIARLQLIFDVQTEAAHSYGRWVQGIDPAVLKVFPAQRFIRVRPVAEKRPYHEVNEGRVELKTNLDFWLDMNRDFGVPWGPWGFNSGMGVEDVDRSEARELGVLKPGEKVDTAALIKFNNDLRASVAGLDHEIVKALEDATGGEVVGMHLRPAVAQNPEKEPEPEPETPEAPEPEVTPEVTEPAAVVVPEFRRPQDAAAWVQKETGIEANFKGMDVDTARSFATAVAAQVQEFPQAMALMEFVGTKTEFTAWKKRILLPKVEEAADKWGAPVGHPDRDTFIKRSLARQSWVSGVKNAIAWHMHDRTRKASVIVVEAKGQKASGVAAIHAAASRSNWTVVTDGADIASTTWHHEIGHLVDKALDARLDTEIKRLWKDTDVADMTRDLSRYAITNIGEMIAESFARYYATSQPTPLAIAVVERIKQIYQTKYPTKP